VCGCRRVCVAAAQSLATVFDDVFPHVHLSGSANVDEEAVVKPEAGGPSEISTAAAIFILVRR
jgi:hypothetical protein